MDKISFAENIKDAEILIKNGFTEIIVSCSEFSRLQKNNLSELFELTSFILKNNCKAILEWDVLYPENNFKIALETFFKIPIHDYSAIRIQDPGVVHYIKNNYAWIPIHLILETGNHNIVGLLKWEDYLGSQLNRLVLSNELSREHLKHYASTLKTPIEVLVSGRILLFYSPRKLLTPINQSAEENFIEASGTSEESPHSGFPLIENKHGTFMFNVKDLSLLDYLDELNDFGIKYARFDLRFDNSLSFINNLSSFKGPRPFIKGFYQINKTDILFSKLKNKRTNRSDDGYLGVVVDVERDKGIAIKISAKKFLRSENTKLKILTPEGKEKNLEKFELKNSLNESITDAKEGDLIICTYVNGVTVKSQVYLN